MLTATDRFHADAFDRHLDATGAPCRVCGAHSSFRDLDLHGVCTDCRADVADDCDDGATDLAVGCL